MLHEYDLPFFSGVLIAFYLSQLIPLLVSFRPETALFRNLCVNQRISLTLRKIARFQIENCIYVARSFRMDTSYVQ